MFNFVTVMNMSTFTNDEYFKSKEKYYFPLSYNIESSLGKYHHNNGSIEPISCSIIIYYDVDIIGTENVNIIGSRINILVNELFDVMNQFSEGYVCVDLLYVNKSNEREIFKLMRAIHYMQPHMFYCLYSILDSKYNFYRSFLDYYKKVILGGSISISGNITIINYFNKTFNNTNTILKTNPKPSNLSNYDPIYDINDLVLFAIYNTINKNFDHGIKPRKFIEFTIDNVDINIRYDVFKHHVLDDCE